MPSIRAPSSAPAWRRWLRSGLLAVAVAAALVFFLRAPSSSVAPLPAYAVSVGAEQQVREPTEPTTRLHLTAAARADGRYELVLRPASAPVDKVVAYAFSVDASGAEPSPLDAKLEVSREGAVRIMGRSAHLAKATEIRIVIGEPAAVGGFEAALSRAAANASDRTALVVAVPIDRD